MGFLDGVSKIMEDSQKRMSSEDFKRAGKVLSDKRSIAREKIQEITSGEIKNIISKLKENKSLTNQDLELVRLWIIGDAESYTKIENNFQDWLNEFKRIESILSEYEKKELTPEDLFKLLAVLEDAIRNASDIGNFLEKQERVKKFEKATKDIASLDREVLAKILTAKLTSPEI